MFSILNPDKNIKLLKLYQYSSKLLIPQLGLNYIMIYNSKIKKELNYFLTIFSSFTLFNTTYHSYVSVSMVLNDYLQKIFKNVKLINFVKLANVKLHIIAMVGYLKYICK